MHKLNSFAVTPVQQVMYMVNRVHDRQIRMVIYFENRIDTEKLIASIKKTLTLEPILNSRFQSRFWKSHWELDSEENEPQFFSYFNSRNLEKDLSFFMGLPLFPEQAPQIQVAVFRNKSDILCIKISHVLADAIGALNYASLLSKVYRNEDFNNLQTKQPGNGNFPIASGLAATAISLHSFRRPRAVVGFPEEPVSGPSFLGQLLETYHLVKLKTYAKKRYVSINEILLTAFYRVLFKKFALKSEQVLPVEVSMNMRPDIRDYHNSIDNLSSAFYPEILIKEQDTFEDTLKRVHLVMNRARKTKPWIAGIACVNLLFFSCSPLARMIISTGLQRDIVLNKFHPSYANLGNIDSGLIDFGIPVYNIAMYGPVQYPPASLLSINTFAGRLNLTMSYQSGCQPDLYTGFLSSFVEELPIN